MSEIFCFVKLGDDYLDFFEGSGCSEENSLFFAVMIVFAMYSAFACLIYSFINIYLSNLRRVIPLTYEAMFENTKKNLLEDHSENKKKEEISKGIF